MITANFTTWRVGIVTKFTLLFMIGAMSHAGGTALPEIKDNTNLCIYGWSRSEPFKNPGGVYFYARRSEVYVADSGNHQVLVFNTAGTPVARIRHSVDSETPGEVRQGEPVRVAVNSRGDILLVDALAGYLDVLDYRGKSIKRIYPGDLLGMARDLVSCSAVAVDLADNVYLATAGGEVAVLMIDPSGKLVRKIGKKGQGEGAFTSITSVWIDGGGKVYTTDSRGEPSVQVFSPEGKVLLGFGAHSSGPNNFSLPEGVVTDELGNIYVIDGLRHWIGAFSPTGQFITRLGGGFGDRPGDLAYPTSLAGDGKRTLFTTEKVGARLQGFNLKITPPKSGD